MQLTFPFPPDRDDRFATYLTGDKNAETVALCRAFIEERSAGKKSLVLHGPPGCGKTHLLAAMGEEVAKRGGEALYISGDMVAATLNNVTSYDEIVAALSGYQGAHYLAVDQLDKVAGTAAEEQVFHLYNAVIENGGLFAAATQAAPAKWRFADYLATRLLWGQVVAVEQPGDDIAALALQKSARDRGLLLPPEVATWMVTRLPRDLASLLAALDRIDRRSLTEGRKVSIPLVRDALEK